MLDKIYKSAPHFIQNIMVSLYNFFAYRKRYGGNYKKYKQLYKKNKSLSVDELHQIQEKNFLNFLKYTSEKSIYYKKVFEKYNIPNTLQELVNLPIIDKETLRKNIKTIRTIDKKEAIVSKTGGTTGKSLEVYFTKDDMQKRFAVLDNFRNNFGYELGKKTAWFSGKTLLTERDINKNRFWKTDYLYKVRYYSTFHIHQKYLLYYLKNIIDFKPEYMVGFPSSMIEIAKYGIANKIDFPANQIKAIFPTAETVTDEVRNILESFFKTNVYDQYASSEGAPFIFECVHHNLHLELQSGIFEVLDENNQPTKSGKLVVTSFTTHGTPLIRYDIGDDITLSDKTCNCGNNNPLVERINGRIDDYIYSPETGKINLGNISNTLKGVYGIKKFQVIQNQLNAIDILIIIDQQIFNSKSKHTFIKNWQDRVGNEMTINLLIVDEIPNEKSGKFRLIKNNIKQLIK